MNGNDHRSIIINLDPLNQKKLMRAFAFIILLSIAPITYGHDYFFAFAEIEYNDISEKFEATLTLSTHDLEMILEKENVIESKLDEITKESKDFKGLADYLRKHFSIKSGNDLCYLNFIGHETLLNGTTNIYFESNPIKLVSKLEFSFDLFMNHYNQQQNKITFYHRGKNYTLPFLFSTTKQTLNLENE